MKKEDSESSSFLLLRCKDTHFILIYNSFKAFLTQNKRVAKKQRLQLQNIMKKTIVRLRFFVLLLKLLKPA